MSPFVWYEAAFIEHGDTTSIRNARKSIEDRYESYCKQRNIAIDMRTVISTIHKRELLISSHAQDFEVEDSYTNALCYSSSNYD